jgi:hypothetical protein
MLVKQSNRLTDSGEKGESFDMVHVSHFFIDGTIPIKKYCPVCHMFVLETRFCVTLHRIVPIEIDQAE